MCNIEYKMKYNFIFITLVFYILIKISHSNSINNHTFQKINQVPDSTAKVTYNYIFFITKAKISTSFK